MIKKLLPFPDDVISYILKQAFDGIRECHKNYITHSDLKAANIFLHYDGPDRVELNEARDLIKKNFRVVLGDFGMASALTADKSYLFGRKGTPYYYSPEIWFSKKFNEKSDIWAMGCLAIFLYFNRYMIVFDRNTMNEQIYKDLVFKGIVRFTEP